MGYKTNLNITVDKELVRLIDMDRGQAPRSSFINNILLKFFKKSHEVFDWGEEHRLAEEDIKSGNVRKFTNKENSLKWLKS
jgi:hypothetical protein